MKFYGHGLVWDTQNNKRLCRFENGVYETDEKREIDILQSLNYSFDKEQESEKPKSKRRKEVVK